MKLKLRIPTLDSVPEAQRAFYRAMDGGGFILDHDPDPDGYGIDNLANIRGKLDERARDYERVNQRLQAFKKADGSLYTAEELQAMLTLNGDLTKTVETLKDKTKTDEQKLATMVAEATKPLHAEIAKHKGSVDRYRSSVVKAEKQRAINKALDILKPQDRWRNMIARDLEGQIDIRENEDGSFTHVIIHPETGKARMSSLQGRDGAMDIEEYAKGADLRKTFGDCLQGDGKKGAGITDPIEGKGGGGGKTGADVVIPKSASQAQFEAAFAQAAKQGGEVVYEGGDAQSD